MRDDLTVAELRRVLHYDPKTGIFTRIAPGYGAKVGRVPGANQRSGPIQIGVNGRHYLANRLAWLYVYGEWPDTPIDHKDRNKTNNRIKNLRKANFVQNGRNRGLNKNNTTGLKGVYPVAGGNRWKTYIRVNKKTIHLGVFETAELAHEFRQLAEATVDPVFFGHEKWPVSHPIVTIKL